MQVKSQKSKVKKYFLFLCFLLLTLIGCSTVKEIAKGVAGISTKALEDGRKNAIVKDFNYDQLTCYNKVEDLFVQIGPYIYAKDKKKKMLAIYLSQADTTPVGVFFTPIDGQNTKVEVSSPSTYAKEYMAKKVFAFLEGKLDLSKEKPEVQIQETLGKRTD